MINSILTNSSALAALQSLNMTENNLNITQNQVSSGLAVANASDNAAYWSIATELNSDSGMTTAANSALTQSQAVMDTANSAIQSVITTINSIQTALTEATNPGVDYNTINTTLASLSKQLTDAVGGASFNGTNLLDGSIDKTNTLNGAANASINFVSGFDANATGGSINQIAFSSVALTGGVTAAQTVVTAQEPNVTDTTLIHQLTGMTSSANAAPAYDNNAIAVTQGTAGTTSGTVVISSIDANGVTTATTYTAIDGNGQAQTVAGAAGFTVSQTVTTPAGTPTGLLSATGTVAGVTGNYDLTALGNGAGSTKVTANNAADMLSAVGVALANVTTYAAQIGATQERMTAASTLNSDITTNLANGVSGLVDADMNTASTRLQALQTQQQLGIQALSIANQNSQMILKLFNG